MQEEMLPAALTDAHRCAHISLQVPVRRLDDLSNRLTKNPDHRGKWRAGSPMSHFTNRSLHNYREIPVQERLLILPKQIQSESTQD